MFNKSEKINKALSDHYYMNLELGIYYMDLYHQVNSMGMPVFAEYIKELSDDKITIHKDLISKYMADVDQPIVGNIKPIQFKKFNSPKEINDELFRIETDIRKEVNRIADLTITEKDYEAFTFWKWFVKDGLKDYGEIVAINDAFNTSSDLLLIDEVIRRITKKC